MSDEVRHWKGDHRRLLMDGTRRAYDELVEVKRNLVDLIDADRLCPGCRVEAAQVVGMVTAALEVVHKVNEFLGRTSNVQDLREVRQHDRAAQEHDRPELN